MKACFLMSESFRRNPFTRLEETQAQENDAGAEKDPSWMTVMGRAKSTPLKGGIKPRNNSPLEGGQGGVVRSIDQRAKDTPLTPLKGGIIWMLVALLNYLALACELHAQENPPPLAQVQRAYEALKFEEAERLGRVALQHSEEYSATELVQLHLIMGYLGYLHKQPEAARGNFESALSLQPDLTLDSLLVSPKIVRLFEQVKNEFRVGLSSRKPAIKYVMVEDQRLHALRRSLLLPGWGQRHLRRNTRGAIYTTGFVLALGTGLAFHVAQGQAHRSYLAANAPSQIERRYELYSQRYRLRNAAFIAAGSMWAINVLDVLLVTPPVSLRAGPSAKAFEVNVSLPFTRP